MKKTAILLGAALTLLPTLAYFVQQRYHFDPAFEQSVCQSVLCSDDVLLESANRLADGDADDKATALAFRLEAVRRNSASPNRWSELGEALLANGRVEEARYSFDRAIELGPQNAPVLWRTALFHSSIDEPNRGHEHIRKMLNLVPEYEKLAFDTFMSSGSTLPDILEHGIPRDGEFGRDFFRYLLSRNAPLPDLQTAWLWLEDHSLTDDHLAGDYTDFLLKNRVYAAALETWKRSAGRHDDAYLNPNFIFNGGFELDPLESGLDWRLLPAPGVRMNRDSTGGHSGGSSLQIEFEGKDNIDFASVTQNVVVQPGRYRFKAWVRSSELTTDEGVAFRVMDPSLGQLNLRSSSLTGTHDWTPIELNFTVPAGVRLLRIDVVRQPSWKFDNKISGKVWIDSVSLVRI
jgi:tetratricopeptide (TPR) repeat protein